jgi:hypothetical protein
MDKRVGEMRSNRPMRCCRPLSPAKQNDLEQAQYTAINAPMQQASPRHYQVW